MLSTETMDAIKKALKARRETLNRRNIEWSQLEARDITTDGERDIIAHWRSELTAIDAALAELAALRQGQWQPLPEWNKVIVADLDGTDFETIRVSADGLKLAYIVTDEIDTIDTSLPLPENIRLCRFVTPEATNG